MDDVSLARVMRNVSVLAVWIPPVSGYVLLEIGSADFWADVSRCATPMTKLYHLLCTEVKTKAMRLMTFGCRNAALYSHLCRLGREM